jgi:hypothetical protein
MKERRPHDARRAGEERPGTGDAASVDERIANDSRRLRSVRAQDLPSLHETIRDAQKLRPDPGLEPNGIRRILMQALGFIRTRPLVAAASVAVVLVIASMVIPVLLRQSDGSRRGPDDLRDQPHAGAAPWDREGHEGPARRGIGLGSGRSGERGMSFVLSAMASGRSRRRWPRPRAAWFMTWPRRRERRGERRSPQGARPYPVAAYAWDQIIQISVDGKSAAQLENEIRQKLAEAGVPNAEVSVSDGTNGRNVTLKVRAASLERRRLHGARRADAAARAHEGRRSSGRRERGQGSAPEAEDQDGAVTLIADVVAHGKSAKIEVPNVQSMSDSELANTFQTKFREAGLNVNVHRDERAAQDRAGAVGKARPIAAIQG